MSVDNREAAQLRIAVEGPRVGWREKTALLLIGDLVDDDRVYWEARDALATRMGARRGPRTEPWRSWRRSSG